MYEGFGTDQIHVDPLDLTDREFYSTMSRTSRKYAPCQPAPTRMESAPIPLSRAPAAPQIADAFCGADSIIDGGSAMLDEIYGALAEIQKKSDFMMYVILFLILAIALKVYTDYVVSSVVASLSGIRAQSSE